MKNTADVIIIGGGIHGASLAFHLGQRGLKTLVLEKNVLASGATGRSDVERRVGRDGRWRTDGACDRCDRPSEGRIPTRGSSGVRVIDDNANRCAVGVDCFRIEE